MSLLLLALGAGVILPGAEPADPDFPTWAYPVPAPTPEVPPVPDDGSVRHVPGSALGLTRAQFAPHVTDVADWHPEEHPPMPAIVGHGREPAVWACAYCHLPNGAGKPENASLAGLTVGYIKMQVGEFRRGDRPGSDPRRGPQRAMNDVARGVTDDELDAAARYFSALPRRKFLKVIESERVPHTYVAGALYARRPGGGSEPIGRRIVEVPDTLEQVENRDSQAWFTAYVPPGSIARGAHLVATAVEGRSVLCSTCHGPDMRGLVEIPRLAGRSPTFLMRQLYDIKTGHRTGSSALMVPIVARVTTDEMLAIVAYLASLPP